MPSDPVAEARKSALRRQLRAARRALSPAQQRQHATAIAHRLRGVRAFRAARHIAYYFADDGEIDLSRLPRAAARAARRWYLPIVRPFGPPWLWFARHRPGAPLRPNRYGIPEPRPRRPLRRANQLDLVLLPLVGFDARCQRLGRGGAFYDRTLAFLRGRRHWRRPVPIGVAHEVQRVATLPAEPWDVPLAAVITETGVYRCWRAL